MKRCIAIAAPGLAAVLAAAALAGCPELPKIEPQPFTLKLNNTGEYAIVGAYVVPAGQSGQGWGPNLLEDDLAAGYYVLIDELDRVDYDFRVVFRKNQDLAQLIRENNWCPGVGYDYATWQAGLFADGAQVLTGQWGNVAIPGETPAAASK